MRISLEAKLEAGLKGRVGRQAGLVRGGLQSPVGGWGVGAMGLRG